MDLKLEKVQGILKKVVYLDKFFMNYIVECPGIFPGHLLLNSFVLLEKYGVGST